MNLLEVRHVQKIYQTRFGSAKVEALQDIDFTVASGEYVAIMGESGSGKTTLLNILATLDRPTSGQVLLEGVDVESIGDASLSRFRRDNLGFVFQNFNLLDTFSIRDNILLPMVLARVPLSEMEPKLSTVAAMLGIEALLEKYPYELSGGQQQRAAVGRAIITEPALILADEPTGALDSRSAGALLEIFEKINQNGQTLLMVTHSIQAASHAQRVIFIKDGCLYNQIHRGERSINEMFQLISDTLAVMNTQEGLYE